MGSVRTILFAVWGLFAPAVAHAEAPFVLFASCAGRLSALMEHQWQVDGPASEATRAERDAMVELAEAAAPLDAAGLVMSWRVQARAAQAALLRQATYGRDPQGLALRRSAQLLAECRGLVLGQV
jgi:hypothetical protein